MKKYYKVINLLKEKVLKEHYIFSGWYDLQESLNNGYIIERADSCAEGMVYILSKEFNQSSVTED